MTTPGAGRLTTGSPSEGPVGKPVTENGARANNPHFVQADLAQRGYGVLEARPDELLVDFRIVGTTQQPQSPVETLARFRVASGVPRVERLG